MNLLPFNKQVRVVSHLLEGASIRGTARLTGTHKDTIARLGVRVGHGCALLHDELMRDLHCNELQVDELWSYVGKREWHIADGDPDDWGDSWVFLAVDAVKKTIVAFHVGRRDAKNTNKFMCDLAKRLRNRPHLVSDGWRAYPYAVSLAFSGNVDYAVLSKQYVVDSDTRPGKRFFVPSRVTHCLKEVVEGEPDRSKVCTSFVERVNGTLRNHCRRFQRKTMCYSKTVEGHRAAVALWVAYYNFCLVHDTLRVTPAMELGVTGYIWNVRELVGRALECAEGRPAA